MAFYLTDNCSMPYGIHKGKAMIDVPADYLIWAHDNKKCSNQVRTYIVQNWDALQKEKKELDAEKIHF